MNKSLLNIVNNYLLEFPNEQLRQKKLLEYLSSHTKEQSTDWNNFDGHIVASGFVYSIEDKKFLVLYHKDLKMYLYPGGHVDKTDESILSSAIREVKEETGLVDFELFDKNNSIPIDIDTHIIGYNERLNLPEHYHFDFRYLFVVDRISDVHIDSEESSDYRWIDMNELRSDPNYGNVASKIENLLVKQKTSSN